MCEIHVLHNGYSYMKEGSSTVMKANATCTLVKSPHNTIIVDTLTPWDKDLILSGLQKLNVTADDITIVISTHGHSDHTGNNHLFTNASYHIVGYCIHNKDEFLLHPFDQGVDYKIDDFICITPTPGHTNEDISVICKTLDRKTTAIVGDLYEKEEDVKNPSLWKECSFDHKLQQIHRLRIAKLADFIIPGHGPMFAMNSDYVEFIS